MEKNKIQAECASCHVKFYIPEHLLNQKRPCPRCNKILSLSTTPRAKLPKSFMAYGSIFLLLTILFMLVWISMLMENLRNGSAGILQIITIGTVIICSLLFTTTNLFQGKIIARFGLYIFMIINTCGAVWQHQNLKLLHDLSIINGIERQRQTLTLFAIQLSFFTLIYIPLLYMLRRNSLRCKDLQR